MTIQAGIFLAVVFVLFLGALKISIDNNRRAQKEKELSETFSKAH